MEKIHLILEPNQEIFFISDMHLGHRNILDFCSRPFENTKQMDKELIKCWNEVVGENDIVFNCGDFLWFPSRHDYAKVLKQLNGTHYIIPGNHDDVEKMIDAVQSYNLGDKVFVCQDIVHVYLEGYPHAPRKIQEIILCHYPLLTWSHSDHQTIHLFGHIHSRTIGSMEEFKIPMQFRHNMLDVGADAHNYTPIKLTQVYEELRMLGLNQSDKNWGLQLVRERALTNQPAKNGY